MWHYKNKYADSSWVYLMQSKQSGYTKIGLSIDPQKRVKALRWYVPDIELIDCVDAHPVWEEELHRRFAKQHVYGEWFRLTPEQVAKIRELFRKKRENPIPRFPEECTKAAAARG